MYSYNYSHPEWRNEISNKYDILAPMHEPMKTQMIRAKIKNEINAISNIWMIDENNNLIDLADEARNEIERELTKELLSKNTIQNLDELINIPKSKRPLKLMSKPF